MKRLKEMVSEDGFAEFVEELIRFSKLIDDEKGEGIARFAIDNGFEKLSDKQTGALWYSIKDFIYEKCSQCSVEIPWCEMLDAIDNDGLCSCCLKMNESRENE